MPENSPRRLGSFELLTRIARGGMAEIYLARRRATGPRARSHPGDLVVVKRIRPHLAEEPRFVQMLVEEARLAASIDHPNVVRIFEVGSDGGEHFIAMEYIGWPSVDAISRRARKTGMLVPYGVAVEIVAQAAEGLHAAHELRDAAGRPLNVVHRDVSPQNLILTEEGQVKLLDFGIAKARNTAVHTSTGAIKGKVPYMSPEQCRGEGLDRRTDLFSLGVVLCELVTGRRIFHRTTELMVLKAITEERIPDPAELYPKLPEEIREVILGALQRDRASRYQTAQQMAVKLRHALRVAGLGASPQTLREYVQSECRDLIERCQALKQTALEVADGGEGGDGEDEEVLTRQRSLANDRVRARRETPGATRAAAEGDDGAVGRRRVLGLVGASLAAVALGSLAGIGYRRLAGPGRRSGPPLRFGMAPAFSRDVGLREFKDFLRYLEQRLQRRVELVVPDDYISLRRELLDGGIHIANLPPLQLVLSRAAEPRLRVLVSLVYEGMGTYQGYIVRRAEGAVRALEDLRGKRFCYVDRESTSGYLLARHYLRSRRFDPDTTFASTRFSGSHTAVMRDVLAGRCEAGAIYSGALLNAQKLGIDAWRLPVLASTGEIPNDVIAASPHLSAELSDRIQRTLLEIDPRTHLGRRTVGLTVYPITRFVRPVGDFSLVEEIARSEQLFD